MVLLSPPSLVIPLVPNIFRLSRWCCSQRDGLLELEQFVGSPRCVVLASPHCHQATPFVLCICFQVTYIVPLDDLDQDTGGRMPNFDKVLAKEYDVRRPERHGRSNDFPTKITRLPSRLTTLSYVAAQICEPSKKGHNGKRDRITYVRKRRVVLLHRPEPVRVVSTLRSAPSTRSPVERRQHG